MKTLILIRHTKSDWSRTVTDKDRPIREDRKGDAINIAQQIADLDLIPQYIFCSDALRTIQTAEILCHEWNIPFDQVQLNGYIYECLVYHLHEMVQLLPNEYDRVAIVCHNPSITDFVIDYSWKFIGNMSTSSAAIIDYDINSWELVVKAKSEFKHYLQPKNLV